MGYARTSTARLRRQARRRWALLRLATLALVGSCSLTSCVRTVTKTVPIPVAMLGTLEQPPPKIEVQITLGGDDGCPPAFSACLKPEAAVTLAVAIANARSWMRTAWLRCGARPASANTAPARSPGVGPVGSFGSAGAPAAASSGSSRGGER